MQSHYREKSMAVVRCKGLFKCYRSPLVIWEVGNRSLDRYKVVTVSQTRDNNTIMPVCPLSFTSKGFVLFSFVWGCCKGEGRIWEDWEVNRFGVHDVKLPKNQERS